MMTNRTRTLARETLSERLLAQLRHQVLSGALAPGEAVPTEQDLCLAFGVGRTTVREALQGLAAAGLVTRRRKRLIVNDQTNLGTEDVSFATLAARLSVRDLYETRKLFEARAVELAAEHWTGDDLVPVRAILGDMRDMEAHVFHEADVSFHQALVRLSKNDVLVECFERCRDLFFKLPSYWQVFNRPPRRAQIPDAIHTAKYVQYERIVRAIEARDAVAAGRAMVDLLTSVERDLIAHLEQTREPGSENDHEAGASATAGILTATPSGDSDERQTSSKASGAVGRR